MSGSLRIYFVLGVLLMGDGAQPSGTDNLLMFNLYMKGSPWTDAVANETDPVYIQIKEQVQKNFVGLGGEIRTMLLANNYGCIHVFIEWFATQPTEIFTLTEKLQDIPFAIDNETVSVSTEPCSPPSSEQPPVTDNVLTFNLYMKGSPWTDAVANETDPVYIQIKEQVQKNFVGLGGELRTMLLANNYGCIHVFVEWFATQPQEIFTVTEILQNISFAIDNQYVSVSTMPCSPPSSAQPPVTENVLMFNLYVKGSPWTDAVANETDPVYIQIKEQVQKNFVGLGGELRTMLLANNYGCIHVYVEWFATQPQEIFTLTEKLQDIPFAIDNENVSVSQTPCSPPSPVTPATDSQPTTVTPAGNVCELPPKTDVACKGNPPRYFYNTTSMVCEQIDSTSCNSGFPTLDKCCDACNNKGRCKPGVCPPLGLGPAISCADECTADSSCPGKKICCSNGCARACVVPHVPMPSDCLQRMIAATRRLSVAMSSSDFLCSAVDIPECDASGYWSRQQHHEAFGLSWCVSPYGNYVNNTLTRGLASCKNLSEAEFAKADETKMIPAIDQVCPPSQSLHCCSPSLCERPCKKYPNAICQLNPCGSCKVEYYMDGHRVNCSQGLSQCQMEQMKAESALQERKITVQMKMTSEIDSMEKGDQGDKNWTAICQLPPDSGPCEGYSLQWFYNFTANTCSQFGYGLCEGNDNRFSSAAECYKTCNASMNPCVRVMCPAGQKCRHRYSESCYTAGESCSVTAVCEALANTTYATGIYVPQCKSDGGYSFKQCHGGYCWCVDVSGEAVSGMTNQTSELQCNSSGFIANDAVAFKTCSNGRQPNITCAKKACTHQVCPGSPEATCKVDLCSGNCTVIFVDEEDTQVDCRGNECDVFKFDDEGSSNCSAQLGCKDGNTRYCPESVCHSAESSCTKNHCAVCKVDQCTCEAYFVNAITNERLTQAECRFISLGVCQAKTCQLLNMRNEAQLSGEAVNSSSLPLPQCDEEGGFVPKQCNAEECVCVDELGFPIGQPSGGSCQDIDSIVKVVVVFTFKGSLSDLDSPKIVEELKSALLTKLEESGINPLNVRLGEPYEGSIKMDAEIVKNPDRPQNLALSKNAIEQLVKSGNLNITAGGRTFALDPDETVVTPQTASQVGSEVTTTEDPPMPTSRPIPVDDDDDGLSKTDKIIIGVVCSGVSFFTLIIIIYCSCTSRRNKNEDLNTI